MTKQIVIGSKTVELLANAATPYYYTQIFGEEFLKSYPGKRQTGKQRLFSRNLLM